MGRRCIPPPRAFFPVAPMQKRLGPVGAECAGTVQAADRAAVAELAGKSGDQSLGFVRLGGHVSHV